jgi:hypothetical protein
MGSLRGVDAGDSVGDMRWAGSARTACHGCSSANRDEVL